MQRYSGPLPTPIDRPPILLGNRVRPIQTPYGQELEQRYALLPTELRREVQRFRYQGNAGVLASILRQSITQDDLIPGSDQARLANFAQAYRQLAQRHGIKSTIDFTFTPYAPYAGVASYYLFKKKINIHPGDIYTNSFIYDLLRAVATYLPSMDSLSDWQISQINSSLIQADVPFRLIGYHTYPGGRKVTVERLY